MSNKKLIFGLSILLGAVISFTSLTVAMDGEALQIGQPAPLADYQMQDVSGKTMSLISLKKEKGLLVVFSCNTCPFVVGTDTKEGWEGRYSSLYELCEKNNLGMVLVNSNEAKREGDDSMSEMKKHAKKMGYKMPYVIDKNHALADAVGARTTPHVYLFDANLNLAYRGLIDDNVNSSSEVKEKYLERAIGKLVKGEMSYPTVTKSIGWSIKLIG
jgi:peroxiredoxin